MSFPIFFSNDLFRDYIPSLTSLPGLTAQAAAFSTDVAAQHVAVTAYGCHMWLPQHVDVTACGCHGSEKKMAYKSGGNGGGPERPNTVRSDYNDRQV